MKAAPTALPAYTTIQSILKLVDKVDTAGALDAKVKLPQPSVITKASIEWNHVAFLEAAAAHVERQQIGELAVLLDLMLYGVEKEKLDLDDIFYVVDFVFNNLTVQQAETFWSAIDSRGEDLSRGLVPNGNPGIFLVKILKSLVERLNPFVDTKFRAKVEQFYYNAFGPIPADPSDEQVPLLVLEPPSSETPSSAYRVLLSVEKSLADMRSVAESPESLKEFLEKIRDLDDIFARQAENQHQLKGAHSDLVMSPNLFDFQVRDRSFQYKISIQILLFIEALLMLRPSEIETFTAQKRAKLVWGKLVLDEELTSAVNTAKRVWFARFKSQATPEQLEALRLTITREKEALAFMLLKEKPEPIELDSQVNLDDAEYTPKIRSKHFHEMGNQKLSALWSQSLGPEAFVATNDKQIDSPASIYQRSKSASSSEDTCEADRWVALFMQRKTDWSSLSQGDPPAIGPFFGQPKTPKSPLVETDDREESASNSPAPRDADSPRDGPVKRADANEEEVPSPKRPRLSRDSPRDV